ncbi:hypothetical protein C0J52_02044 [Blattella germanica]|nr:hypothetical protein C0J52_02044 [Blattella germanica]
MVTDSNSVHEQTTQLCKKILRNSGSLDQHNYDIIIKDLRTISFAILLNKSYKSRVNNVDEDPDATSKILAHSYKLYQWNLNEQATKLHRLMDSLQNCDWSNNPVVESVLVFLATLANEEPNDEQVLYSKIQPFQMPSGTKIKPYTEFTPQVFEPPCILSMPSKKTFPFNREPGTGLMLLQKKRPSSTTVKWCYEDLNFTELKKPRNLKIPKVLSFSDHQFKDEGYVSPSQDPSMTMSCRLDFVSSEVWEMVLDSRSPELRTWESLGSINPPREKPYLLEAGNDCVEKLWKSLEGIKHVRRDHCKTEKPLLTSLSRQQLVRDLKFLLVGVPSETFHYNEKEDGFVLSTRVCVEGLTPATLETFCKEFLIAGACCLHLERLIASKSIHEGLMFQALCGSMRRYLHFYRCAVMMLPEGPFLLNLRRQFDGLFEQISCLASLCQVHPQLSEKTLPEGVALLAYLYEEIQKRWMFEGICRDMYSEFFIQERSDLMPCRQREYWSQGHYVLAEAVPGFLHGLEESIFHCGKALNLLKLCNPKDALCEMLQSGYPRMQCCLHSGDLLNLEAEWSSYQYRALAICGKPYSLNLHREEDDLEREMELRAAAAAKSKVFAELKEQVRLAEERKAKEKQRRREEDQEDLKKAIELKEERTKLLELEKTELQAKYLYLSEMAEKRRMRAERQIEQMKMLLPSEDEKDINSNVSDITDTADSKTKSQVLNSEFVSQNQYLEEPNANTVAEATLEHDEENNLKHGTEKCEESKLVNETLECHEKNMNNKTNNEKNIDNNTNELDKENNMAPGTEIVLDRMESFESEPSSANTRNTEMVLGREVESSTTFETASNGSDIESICCNSTEVQPYKLISYSLPLTLGASPLVNINNSLDISKKTIEIEEMDVGTIDMSSISIALQKSILLPLKIQASLVNSALLKYFLETEDLLSHLHSLRNFFFLLDGEFGRNVTNALFRCMYQAANPSDMLNSVTLNSVLSQSVTQNDPHVDRLSFDVKYIPNHFSFSSPLSLDCVMLQYRVGWPLNIILTSTALHKYNDVFEFLLRLRRISWVLEEDFHYLKRAAKEKPELLRSPEYQKLQLYRHEMTHFIHALQTYVTASVLQASWVEFLKNLQRAKNLDDVYRMHVAYVKMVLFRCLLNKQSAAIQKALVDTLRMVLKFHGQLSAGAWQLKSGSLHYQHPKFNTLVQIYSSFHNLAAFIFKFATKLAHTGYQPHLLDLLQLLNMNEFYPQHF